jgi:hypothetical protein
VRVLIFHGYLLRGTGSNVYNASLAQALANQGHEVHLLCQDRAPAELPFVDAVGDILIEELPDVRRVVLQLAHRRDDRERQRVQPQIEWRNFADVDAARAADSQPLARRADCLAHERTIFGEGFC